MLTLVTEWLWAKFYGLKNGQHCWLCKQGRKRP